MSVASMLDECANKPPYRVPSLAEIRKLPKHGRKVVSLFSGGGGSSLGYAMAGFEVVAASEFVPAARATYSLNFPQTPIIVDDVRKVAPHDIMALTGIDVGELDVLDGSPPCASFSEVVRKNVKMEDLWGKEKEYSGTTQRTDDLFDHYLRLLEGLKPKAFVAENVLGLSKGKAKGHFLRIVARMRAAGYRVSVALADAQWLGVPQHRERLIFLGFREDLGIEPDFPTPLLYRYSLKEALEGVVSTEEELAHVSFREHAIYPVWKKLMPGTKRPDKYFNLFRCTWEKPAPTLLATAGKVGGASICHPDEPRKFTVPELRRICSFPDDFALAGEYFHQVERMGRAVPPLMMAKVATTIHRLFGG